MNYEMIYNVLGILMFLLIMYKVFKKNVTTEIQSKDEKKADIINGYKEKLKAELELLKDDKEAQIVKKTELLNKYSEELSRNIFIDANEIRDIVLQLSHI